MQNDRLPIGQFCRELVEDFDQDLPPYVWEHVSSALDNDKKRRRAIVYWSVAASLALLISFSAGYYLAIMRHQDTEKTGEYTAMTKETRHYTRPLILTSEAKVHGENKQSVKAGSQNKFTSVFPQTAESPGKISIHQTTAVVTENTLLQKDTFSGINENMVQQSPVAPLVSEKNESPALLKNDSADLKSDFINMPLPTLKNENIVHKIPEEKESDNPHNKWALAEHISPLYSPASPVKYEAAATLQDANAYAQTETDELRNKESITLFAAGFNLQYKLSKKWALSTGFYYALGGGTYPRQQRQLDIPLMVHYALYDKKMYWSLNGGTGGSVMFYGNRQYVNGALIAGTTLGIKITPRLNLEVVPTIKFNLYPDGNILSRFPLSYAIYSGLSYRF